MILTCKLDLYLVKLNQVIEFKSYFSRTQTDTHTRSIALLWPLEWSVKSNPENAMKNTGCIMYRPRADACYLPCRNGGNGRLRRRMRQLRQILNGSQQSRAFSTDLWQLVLFTDHSVHYFTVHYAHYKQVGLLQLRLLQKLICIKPESGCVKKHHPYYT